MAAGHAPQSTRSAECHASKPTAGASPMSTTRDHAGAGAERCKASPATVAATAATEIIVVSRVNAAAVRARTAQPNDALVQAKTASVNRQALRGSARSLARPIVSPGKDAGRMPQAGARPTRIASTDQESTSTVHPTLL